MNDQNQIWKALLAEFVGTFTLVFFSGSAYALTTSQGGNLVASALATGLALAFCIYIFNRWSGAHLNPIVSLSFTVSGQMNWGLMLAYWVAQFIGAIAAGALVACLFGTANGAGATIGSLTNSDPWKAVMVEAFLTFFLVLGYLQLYRDPMQAIISGVVLGSIMAAIVFAGQYLTGASTNPARSLGTGIFSNNMGSYWVYVVGPLIGAAVAVLVYKLMNMNFCAKMAKDGCGNQLYDDCGNKLVIVEYPRVDKCGRCIKSCDGKPATDRYLIAEPKLGYKQTTPLSWLNEVAREQGFSAQHLAQETMHAFLDKDGTKIADTNLAALLAQESTIPLDARLAVATGGQVAAPVGRSSVISEEIVTRTGPRGTVTDEVITRTTTPRLSPRATAGFY